ncbi:cysteine dioxygenase family protein [Chachezhania sediminis]|uniref:cysteine dioxygenase family protein n=1 Tax=Chachezhania sediminis TaxID=2599291 RepID=UPI00131E5EE1|nr:cysteine dioxygenase [Chachezhania sediminis]
MSIRPFRDFVCDMTDLADRNLGEPELLAQAQPLLAQLLTNDEWLPDAYAEPSPERYQQYLLHCDVKQRFSIVSFVWGPGQATPIHDHTVWGLIGVLRGSERAQRYVQAEGEMHKTGEMEILETGAIDAVSPTVGDIHEVKNGLLHRPSVSIHVYGANIGAVSRHTFKEDGSAKTFISGYTADTVPNLW